MDPKLLAALKALLLARQNAKEVGEAISPADEDAFIQRETAGKFSRKDLEPLLATSGSNLARSAMYGATGNYADELIGMFSKPQAEESKLREDYYKQEHPGRDVLGGILGALVTGKALGALTGAGKAQTLGQVVKTGAKAGAGWGAVAESGAADGQDLRGRIDAASKGAVTGGILGGAFSGVVGTAAAAFNPVRHGIGRIASAIEKDGGLPALQARLKELVAAGRGDQVTVADLGDHLRQALDFAANASDDVLIPTAQLLEARTSGRAGRLLADVRANLGEPARLSGGAPALPAAQARSGEPDAALRATQLATNTSAVGDQVYGDLAAQNPEFDVNSLPLDKPKIARLWAQARAAGNLTGKGPLDDLIARLTASNPGVPRSQLVDAAQHVSSLAAQDAGSAAPALERPVSLDDMMQLRRGLEGQTSEAFAKGNGAMGNALKEIRTHVDDVLEKGAPGFREANATYKGAKDLERGLDAGHDWWMKADRRALERQVMQLKSQPGALDEFRRGIASGLVEKLQATASNRDAARELMQASSDLDAKLKVIFGDKQTFDGFMARVKAERDLGRLGTTIGNSATTRRLTAQGYDPEHLGLEAVAHGPSAVRSAMLKMARMAMTRKTAQTMGPSLLTQGSDNIDALLASLGQQPPLAGPTSTMLGPMGLMALFGH